MRIKLSKNLSTEYSDHLFRWRERVFPKEGACFEWSQPKWHILAFDNEGKPCGHLGYDSFNLSIDGDSDIDVVGVGGVVARPEVQGKGVPAKLFDFSHGSLHAKSLSDTFVLFCPEKLEHYYTKHDYTKFDGTYTFLQKGVLTRTDKFVLMYYGSSISAKEIHIQGELW